MSGAEEPTLVWREALSRSGVVELLASFDPHVAGTLPLGVSVPGSDIDILCHAPHPDDVAKLLWKAAKSYCGLSLRRWAGAPRALIATFVFDGWPFEVFASPVPIIQQHGWRHFQVEERLLKFGGEELRQRVRERRWEGYKTEPAFARVLNMEGDPYSRLFDLSDESDDVLKGLLNGAGLLPMR